jgi:hypothetical protein
LNNLISEEALDEGTEIRVPSPSISLASNKKNPPKESMSKALVVEAQGKPLVQEKCTASRPFSQEASKLCLL